MKMVRWKRFAWDLPSLPPETSVLPGQFVVRPAAREDAKSVNDVIFSVFSLDAAWGDTFAILSGKLEGQVEAIFARPSPSALVITHGPRIIAASLLATEVDAENHLLSGPCVRPEYHNRGLGSALLHASLRYLQQAGLPRAIALCKEKSPTAKFVYRKFGSTSAPCDYDPTLLAEHR